MADYLATYLDGITSTELAEVRAALRRMCPVQVLGMSGAAIAHTGSTSKTTLATIAVPILGVNDAVRVTAKWSFTDTVNDKQVWTELGGTAFQHHFYAASGPTSLITQTLIQNRNSVSAQIGMNEYGETFANSQPFLTGTVNTGVTTNITLAAQLELGSETITLQSYLVELIRAPM